MYLHDNNACLLLTWFANKWIDAEKKLTWLFYRHSKTRDALIWSGEWRENVDETDCFACVIPHAMSQHWRCGRRHVEGGGHAQGSWWYVSAKFISVYIQWLINILAPGCCRTRSSSHWWSGRSTTAHDMLNQWSDHGDDKYCSRRYTASSSGKNPSAKAV